MTDKKPAKGMTAAETKELRRVFDYCANFLPKQEIYAKLNPFLDRKNDLVAFVNNPDAVEVNVDELQQPRAAHDQGADLAPLLQRATKLIGKNK